MTTYMLERPAARQDPPWVEVNAMHTRAVRLVARGVVAAALAATTTLVASPAHAATAGTFSGGVLTLTLASAAQLSVTPYDGAYEVSSDEGITSLPGCGKNIIDQWSCTGVTKVVVTGSSGADSVSLTGDFVVDARLGAGNDDLYAEGNRAVTAHGETGSDYLSVSNHDNLANLGGSHLDGGDGDDRIFGGPADDTLVGGTGNDVVVGNAGNDALQGGDGQDQLFGDLYGGMTSAEDGHDALDGGAGDDVMVGGLGADALAGGSGIDTVDYDNAYDYAVTRAFNASLDGIANDGEAGEGDNIGADGGVENLVIDAFGTFNPMTVVGDDAANKITGAPSGTLNVDLRGGDDMFEGGASDAGTSTVSGGEGNDTISTWGKVVTVDGGAGADTLKTSHGDSTITGGPGRDSVFAGTGNDTIHARDGEVDSISCGIGADVLVGDHVDVVNADPLALCESQDLANVTPTPTPGTPGTPGNSGVVEGEVSVDTKARTKVSRKGIARFKVANGLADAITLKAVLKTKKPRLKVGGGKARIKAGAKGTIKVKLSRKAFRLLKRKGRLKVVLTVTAVSGATGKVVRRTVLRR